MIIKVRNINLYTQWIRFELLHQLLLFMHVLDDGVYRICSTCDRASHQQFTAMTFYELPYWWHPTELNQIHKHTTHLRYQTKAFFIVISYFQPPPPQPFERLSSSAVSSVKHLCISRSKILPDKTEPMASQDYNNDCPVKTFKKAPHLFCVFLQKSLLSALWTTQLRPKNQKKDEFHFNPADVTSILREWYVNQLENIMKKSIKLE